MDSCQLFCRQNWYFLVDIFCRGWNKSSFGFQDVIFVHFADLIHHWMTVSSPVFFSSLYLHSRHTGKRVYLGCASVRACQLPSCLSLEMTGIWDTILCNAIFKEILHNSSFFPTFFWRAFLKVSLANPFNLTSLWSRSAKSWRLGFATSHGTGWYWNDNEVVFWKEWMN